MKQMFGTTRPEIATELAAALTSLQPEFEAQKADLVTATNRIVASTMSESELKEVAAFMKTPTGMKYVEIRSPRSSTRCSAKWSSGPASCRISC